MKAMGMLARIGLVALLMGIGPTVCIGAIALTDENMGTIRGGCGSQLCSGDNPCSSPSCEGLGTPCVRCSGSAIAQKCNPSDYPNTCTPLEDVDCGFGYINAWCWITGTPGVYSCQGGQQTQKDCGGDKCKDD